MNTRTPEQRVFIVDDDEAVLDSLSLFMQGNGLTVRTWSTANAFLDDYRHDWGGCLILDMRLPSLSGLSLQQELVAIGSTLPIIFISGHGSVSTAVQAMKAGAFEFIEKPLDHDLLIDHVRRAFEMDAEKREIMSQQREIRERLMTLTPRESEVLDYVVNGKATKVIALELSLSQRTVEIYRANVMQKMQSRSVAHLVKMLSEFRTGSHAM